MAVSAELLKAMDLFEDLSIDELRDIAALGRLEEFEPGQMVFREGDPAKKFYLIVSGRISIEIEIGLGKRASVYTLTKGRFFGYPSLVHGRTFTTFARCLDKVAVVTIVADELVHKVFDQDCRRGYLVMKKVAELVARKLSETRMQLLSLIHG